MTAKSKMLSELTSSRMRLTEYALTWLPKNVCDLLRVQAGLSPMCPHMGTYSFGLCRKIADFQKSMFEEGSSLLTRIPGDSSSR